MIDFDNLTIWDTYKMVMSAKPLSSKRLQVCKEFGKKFNDIRFNDAAESVTLETYYLPFVYGFELLIYKGEYRGTGYFGEPMELLDGEDYFRKGRRIPGSRFWDGGIGGDAIDEDLAEYETFDDVLTNLLYNVRIWDIWKDAVTERIYQNSQNENKYLSVFEFKNEWNNPEYYVLQFIETYNPNLDQTFTNYTGNKAGDDTHHKWEKADLLTLLEDYTLIEERHPD